MTSPARARFRRGLALAVLGGLVVRLVYVFAVRREVALLGDSYFYHHAANLLADGHGFVVPYDLLVIGETNQAADHPPLFIVYLALWSILGLDSPTAHMVAGAVLGCAAVAVTGLLARRVAGPTVGIVAAAIAATYPNLWSWDAMVLSEPAAAVAVGAVLLAAWRTWERSSVLRVLVLGLAVGLAGLCRAELLLLGPMVALPLLLRSESPRSLAQRAGLVALAGAAALAAIAPWVAYNLTRFEKPVLLSSGLDVTLAYSNCDLVYYGALTGYWDFACAPAALERAGVDPDGLDQSERSEVWRREVLEYAGANLDRVPAVVLARVGRVAGLYKPLQQVNLDVVPEGRELWVARTGMATYYLLAGLSLLGWVALGRQGRLRYPLLMPIIVVALAAAMTFGATRYRVAAEPVLCVLAAVGATVAARAWRSLGRDPSTITTGPDVAGSDL